MLCQERIIMIPNKERISELRQSCPIEELRRKAKKARCKTNIWTCEEMDLSIVEGSNMLQTILSHSGISTNKSGGVVL